MTILSTWVDSAENPQTLWMASDSRVSDGRGILMDHGVKVFELPVISRAAGDSGFFDRPYFVGHYGLGCAGSTLAFQNMYATAVPLLGNLIGTGDRWPSLREIAEFVAGITNQVVSAIGGRRGVHAASVSAVICGVCAVNSRYAAFHLRPEFDAENTYTGISVNHVDLTQPQFYGDCVENARLLHAAMETTDGDDRRPLRVIKELIADETAETIGGDIQIGHTIGHHFNRVSTLSPVMQGEPAAVLRMNGIALDELPAIGPCAVGISGMTTGPD